LFAVCHISSVSAPDCISPISSHAHSGVGFDIDDDGAVRPADATRGRTPEKVANESTLLAFAGAVDGRVLPVAEAIEVLAVLKARAVLQRVLFKGLLEIGTARIPVTSFTKTAEQRFPSLKPVMGACELDFTSLSVGLIH
jgi:hypothetical protein